MTERNVIKPHMEVIGSDDVHIGIVDAIEDGRIRLTKDGSDDGQHHYVPTAIVQDIVGNVVTMTKTAQDASESET